MNWTNTSETGKKLRWMLNRVLDHVFQFVPMQKNSDAPTAQTAAFVIIGKTHSTVKPGIDK
jgi:hypothetical protein